jgi:hypothetical protein
MKRTTPKKGQASLVTDEIITERVLDLLSCYHYALSLFNDKHQARRWLIEKNSFYFNVSPAIMCLSGRAESVLRQQEEMLGVAPSEQEENKK